MPEPKRKRKKTSTTSEQPVCVICKAPAVLGEEYCAMHLVSYFLVGKAVDATNKALRSGNVGQAAGAAAATVILQAGGPMLERAVASMAGMHSRPAGQAPKAPRRGPDPMLAFRVLGLDPKRATVEDVKRVQRELAKIYHPDTAGEAMSKEKMKEVNAAVEACLMHITGTARGS